MYEKVLCALAVFAPCVASSQGSFPSATVAAEIRSLFPGRNYSVWSHATGDINDDGIEDLALVLADDAGGQRHERLLVLTGSPDRALRPLSVSGEFCNTRNFYSMAMAGPQLSVQGFSTLPSSGSASTTFKFRYNSRLNDLELIGQEYVEEDVERNSLYRVSSNYLATTVVYSRKDKGKYKEMRIRMATPSLPSLSGFDCTSHLAQGERVYIDESLQVRKP